MPRQVFHSLEVASGTQLVSLGNSLAGKDTDKGSSRRAWEFPVVLAGARSVDRALLPGCRGPWCRRISRYR